ncbi:MAG TPA: MerR family transcriptional regulator [Candidatus Dormibacteraeota bacterium]|nr:MerR family transcriptional regulator [Candidatus Dormibacteraeota bacterium]
MKDDGTRLLTIGEFAARTRLAPSALRYYDDAGLLRPAHVDPGSGYRRYAPAQVPEAVLIRELRALAMPVAEVRALLDAGPADAHARLDAHWRAVEARVAAARTRLAAAHRLIDHEEEMTMGPVVTIEADALATAIRQVLPAAPTARLTRPGADRELPAGVLVEVSGNVLRLVATDAHRLAMRDLVPDAIAGGDGGRIVAGSALRALAEGLAGGGYELRLDELPEEAGPFPDYGAVLDRLARTHRLVATVEALRARIEASDSLVLLDGFAPPLTVGFDRGYLLAALEAAEGPDVIVETGGPLEPALIRSATDGSFTAIVMPVRLQEPPSA